MWYALLCVAAVLAVAAIIYIKIIRETDYEKYNRD